MTFLGCFSLGHYHLITKYERHVSFLDLLAFAVTGHFSSVSSHGSMILHFSQISSSRLPLLSFLFLFIFFEL